MSSVSVFSNSVVVIDLSDLFSTQCNSTVFFGDFFMEIPFLVVFLDKFLEFSKARGRRGAFFHNFKKRSHKNFVC